MQHHQLLNNSSLTLREARPDDAEKLIVFLKCVENESDNIAREPGDFTMTVEQEQHYLSETSATANNLCLLALIDDEIIGSLNATASHRRRIQHQCEIGISVRRPYWNLGIGGHLMAYLIDWATTGGVIRKINLHVRVDNLAAIHLYEKYGFIREGRVSRELCIRGEFIDGYLMGRLIDPQT